MGLVRPWLAGPLLLPAGVGRVVFGGFVLLAGWAWWSIMGGR